MKQTQWFMAVGIVFSLGVFLLAVFAEDPWVDHAYNKAPPIAAGVPAPHRDGRDRMTCSSCHEIIASRLNGTPRAIPPLAANAPVPPSHRDGREKMTCANCHTMLSPPKVSSTPTVRSVTVALTSPTAPPRTPATAALDPEWHERFLPTRFQGKILQVVENSPRSGRLNTHILVHNGINAPVWINLAPKWFLRQARCQVGAGMFVKGMAFQEMGSPAKALRYAQSVAVNGHQCVLRDNHLRSAWLHNPAPDQDEE
ncbi:MAG: magnetochrome domain-containing protein [Magnetococcales bacterium]|nr:magnetochrome domain-containing protein [Magnetococcales bacterium]